MKKINLKEIKIEPHPTHAVFKKHGISVGVVSIALGMTYSHVSSMLTGIRKPTTVVDLKLKELAKSLDDFTTQETIK